MPYVRFTQTEQIEIEKLVFSLHVKPSTSLVTRPEVDPFIIYRFLFILQMQCFCNYFHVTNSSNQFN